MFVSTPRPEPLTFAVQVVDVKVAFRPTANRTSEHGPHTSAGAYKMHESAEGHM